LKSIDGREVYAVVVPVELVEKLGLRDGSPVEVTLATSSTTSLGQYLQILEHVENIEALPSLYGLASGLDHKLQVVVMTTELGH